MCLAVALAYYACLLVLVVCAASMRLNELQAAYPAMFATARVIHCCSLRCLHA